MLNGKVKGWTTEESSKPGFELVCFRCGETFFLSLDEAIKMDLLESDGTVEVDEISCQSCADAEMADVTRDWVRR